MIVSFDENVQERDCIVLFKFKGEFDICVSVIGVVQELGCRVFIVDKNTEFQFEFEFEFELSIVNLNFNCQQILTKISFFIFDIVLKKKTIGWWFSVALVKFHRFGIN